MTLTMRVRPRRVAAPAPQAPEAPRRDAGLPGPVEQLCMDWGAWVATRRLLAPPPLRSVIGQLRQPASTASGGPNVRLNVACAAFHMALSAQPERAQAVVYAIYALPRLKHGRVHVKQIAQKLGISRSTVYRLRDDAAQRAYQQHFVVMEQQRELLESVANHATTNRMRGETLSGENRG